MGGKKSKPDLPHLVSNPLLILAHLFFAIAFKKAYEFDFISDNISKLCENFLQEIKLKSLIITYMIKFLECIIQSERNIRC